METMKSYREALHLLALLTPRGGVWCDSGTAHGHWRNWHHDTPEDRLRTARLLEEYPVTQEGLRDTPFDVAYAGVTLSLIDKDGSSGPEWLPTVHLFHAGGLQIRQHGLTALRGLSALCDLAGFGPWSPPVQLVQSWHLLDDDANHPCFYFNLATLPPLPHLESPLVPTPTDP